MDTCRPPRRPRRPRSLTLVIASVMLLGVGVASAGATSNIEGVWSFGGGQIAIQPLSNETFAGTVVAETKFALCTHPVGQQIWTGMKLQTDGSYVGLHQWYIESKPGACEENPERGPTAWRVLEAADGSHFLRVCFSEPGGPQPSIAANGAPKGQSEYHAYGVNYGCTNSSPIAPLPVVTGSGSTPGTNGGSGSGGSGGSGGKSGAGVYKESLSLPNSKQCLSVRLFKIHLQDPKYDPFKTVSVTIKGRKIPTARKGKYFVATINLEGLPVGAFTVKIKATTVLGHSLSASRTYHTCKKKIKKQK